MTEAANILLIDDDEAIRDSCGQVLAKEGYRITLAKDGREGLDAFSERFFHLVFLDLKMPGMDGMAVLAHIKEENPATPVIIITGHASIHSAVEAIKGGAFDYLAKPFSPEELRVIAKKALNSRKMFFKNLSLQKELELKTEFDFVIGKSEAMQRVLNVVKQVSPTDSTVLITGESGTGKELLAREIHKHSFRHSEPFVVIDCGALVETLFESELFGHVRGSFTGAHETKHGRFEVADGGTIFLDEISNISPNTQAKLLRAIQEREVTRVGSTKPIKVDVRILAATNEDLAECVKKGTFREDLFYRLSVVPIHLPRLSERSDDIPLLADHFLVKYCRKMKKSISGISQAAKKALIEYDWPGNIRELENTIERAVVLAQGSEIHLDDLVYHGIGTSQAFMSPVEGVHKSLEEVEKNYIKMVLDFHHGNRSRAAGILRIDRKTLLAKIKKYRL